MGRISQQLAGRTSGTLPSNTTENPKNKGPSTSYSQVKSISEEFEVKEVETAESPDFDDDVVIRVRDELYPGSKLDSYFPRYHSQPNQPEDKHCKSIFNSDDLCFSVPLVDVLAGKTQIGQFIKGLVEKDGESKKALVDAMTEKRVMPPKIEDPGPFIIPCSLDGSGMLGALADSGACINVIPYSLYMRLNLGELAPAKNGVRFFDRVCSKPIGIAENVVVKVGELEFLADFVVVDIEEDTDVPLVLGRPFLATAGALIDVKEGKLTLRDRGRKMSFQTKHTSTPPPTHVHSVYSVLTAKTVEPNKCGGVEKVSTSEPSVDEETLARSMRKLYSRVHRAMSDKDERLRTRLVSNLSRKEKDKLLDFIEEARVADAWLLSNIGYVEVDGGSYGLMKGDNHHPGIS